MLCRAPDGGGNGRCRIVKMQAAHRVDVFHTSRNQLGPPFLSGFAFWNISVNQLKVINFGQPMLVSPARTNLDYRPGL